VKDQAYRFELPFLGGRDVVIERDEADQAVMGAFAMQRHAEAVDPAFCGDPVERFGAGDAQSALGSQFVPGKRRLHQRQRLDQRVVLQQAGLEIIAPPALRPFHRVEDRALPDRRVDLPRGEGIDVEWFNKPAKAGNDAVTIPGAGNIIDRVGRWIPAVQHRHSAIYCGGESSDDKPRKCS